MQYLQFHFVWDKLFMSFRLILNSLLLLFKCICQTALLLSKRSFLSPSSPKALLNHASNAWFSGDGQSPLFLAWHVKRVNESASCRLIYFFLSLLNGLSPPMVNCSPSWSSSSCFWYIPQFGFRFSQPYQHSILCTRTLCCDIYTSVPRIAHRAS